jgi:hypothetical protein
MRNAGTPTLPVPQTITRCGMARTLAAGRGQPQAPIDVARDMKAACWERGRLGRSASAVGSARCDAMR